jgi:predicted alpha/beta hydrolase
MAIAHPLAVGEKLGGTILGLVDKGLERFFGDLAHFQGESLRLLGITLEVLVCIAGQLIQGCLELAFHLLGLGIQVGFVQN